MKNILQAIKSAINGVYAYIEKNRTHGTKETNLILADNWDGNEENTPKCNFTPGNEYTVIFDGVKYEGLVCYFDGDFNVIAERPKYPFYIDDDGGDTLYVEADFEWNTLSIIETKQILKLDEKYLPDGVSAEAIKNAQAAADNAPVYITITSTDSGYQSTHSYQDIKKIIESGKLVYAVHENRVYPFDEINGDPEGYNFAYHRFDERDLFSINEYGDINRLTQHEQDFPLNHFFMYSEGITNRKTYKVTIRDGVFVITERT